MDKKTLALGAGGCTVLVLGLLLAICVGAKSIPLATVWESIFRGDGLEQQLVRNVRLPRALASAMVGGLLGMAGAMMQGITRNPIAEPSIMGMTQGATLAVAFASVSSSVSGLFGNSAAALIGAVVSGILVLLFSMQSAANMKLSRLLLAGTAMSTFFISMATVVALLGNRSQELAFWISGGFQTAVWKHVLLLVVVGGISFILSLLMAGRINIVNLGEDTAVGLGVNPTKVRLLTIVILIPVCAVSVAVAGNIAFVGLIIPNIVRRLLGNDYRKMIPLSFILGAALLAWADIAARMVNQPYETPIGLFSSLVGVPIFLLLVRKEKS